jgi:hypothetical protein
VGSRTQGQRVVGHKVFGHKGREAHKVFVIFVIVVAQDLVFFVAGHLGPAATDALVFVART